MTSGIGSRASRYEECLERGGTTSYSVLDSIYASADKGRFPDLTYQSDLWQLLLRMSARKVIGKRRHDRRQQRGDDVKLHSLDDGEDNKNVIGDEPSPEMVLLTRESVEQFFSHFGVGHLRDLSGARLVRRVRQIEKFTHHAKAALSWRRGDNAFAAG